MKRLLSVTIAVSVVCGALASFGANVAGAAAPQRILTATEYKQMTAEVAAGKKVFGAKTVNWSRARAACAVLGNATALLKSERVLCLNQDVVVKALTVTTPQEQKCLALLTNTTTTTTTTPTTTTPTTTTGTTTTGTTTTGTITSGTTTTPTSGTESTGAQALVCLTPVYKTLQAQATKSYASDLTVRKLSKQRGFKGVCLNTLAATTTQLRKENAFVGATKKLVADLVLFTKIESGAASSNLSETQVGAVANAFTKAANTYLLASGPSKLSVCPHQ
jgi:hypothetical protein